MADNLIRIAYLYEDLMNTYGDSGDVKILRYFLQKKGWQTQIDNISLGSQFNADDYDFVFFGGGQDYEQSIVAKDLQRFKETLNDYIQAGNPMLAICGGYELMGTHYNTISGTKIKGLGILPLHTEFDPEKRMIGDTKYETEWGPTIGFENHSGQTFLREGVQPLGTVNQDGRGNNGEDHTEGARVHNVIGTYMHGSLLPKNPAISDFLIETAVTRRYGTFDTSDQTPEQAKELARLDQVATNARKAAAERPR